MLAVECVAIRFRYLCDRTPLAVQVATLTIHTLPNQRQRGSFWHVRIQKNVHTFNYKYVAKIESILVLKCFLHWLRASQRIEYKVAVLTYKVLYESAPRYLGPLVPVADLYKAGGHCVLPAPIALWCLPSGSLPSVAGLSRLLLHASGTPCQRRPRQLSR